jgi:AraC-like DNA-binding protein
MPNPDHDQAIPTSRWIEPVTPLAPALEMAALLDEADSDLGLRITVHDRSGMLPDLPADRRFHATAFCQGVRSLSGCGACIPHCQDAVNREASRSRSPFIQHCWRGGCEIVVPVVHGGAHVATIFAGVFRGDAPAANLPPALRAQAADLPVLERRGLATRVRRLLAVGAALLAVAARDHEPSGANDNRRTRILHLIRTQHHRSLHLAALATALRLSPSRTSHLVHELFGRSFRSLLIGERLAHAKTLLTSTDLSVTAVAERTGFSSPYHFVRLFTRHLGSPPGRWRRRASA